MLLPIRIFMRKFYRIIAVLFLITSTPIAWAWNAKGHVLVSQIAFDNLSLTAKEKVNKYAEFIIGQLPDYMEQQLEHSYKGATLFAKLSPLPDTWRGMTIEKIFQRFNAPLPNALKSHRDDTTDTWHYEDRYYPQSNCQQPQNIHLKSAFNMLQKALQEADNTGSQAVIVLLLVHLIEDAHQPLHTMTQVDKHCRTDKGGNTHPILIRKHAKTNLHKMWDLGVGYLNRSFNYQTRSLKLQQEFPKQTFKHEVSIISVPHWMTENYQHADFIYSIGRYQHLTPSYYRQAQDIVRFQLTLSGYRLAYWLNHNLPS